MGEEKSRRVTPVVLRIVVECQVILGSLHPRFPDSKPVSRLCTLHPSIGVRTTYGGRRARVSALVSMLTEWVYTSPTPTLSGAL